MPQGNPYILGQRLRRPLGVVPAWTDSPKAYHSERVVAGHEFSIDLTAETVWATQAQIADLFERDKSTISEHIKNILSEKELDEAAVVGKFPTTGADGKT